MQFQQHFPFKLYTLYVRPHKSIVKVIKISFCDVSKKLNIILESSQFTYTFGICHPEFTPLAKVGNGERLKGFALD